MNGVIASLVIRQATVVVEQDLSFLDRRGRAVVVVSGQVLALLAEGPGPSLVGGNAVAVKLEEIEGVSAACPEAPERVVVKPVPLCEHSPCAPLALLLAFAQRIGYFEPFSEHLEVAAKEVVYSNLQKLQTLVAALAVGCPHNVDINHYLAPYPAVARVLGMRRFPDQSQVNRFLRRMEPVNLCQLQLILEILLERFGLWRSLRRVDVDLDTTGLTVTGSQYELARKGYFPGRRGKRGYQLNVAMASETSETLALSLDPGNIPPGERFVDMLYAVMEVVGPERMGMIRADATHGTMENLLLLLDLGLDFTIKGRDPRTARNLAHDIPACRWETVDIGAQAADAIPLFLGDYEPVRTVVVKVEDGRRVEHAHIYTTMPEQRYSPAEVVHSYNGRQTIEALIKSDKQGPKVANLRTRSFPGLYSFMYLAAITMNLLVLFQAHVLRGTRLEGLGLPTIINRLMHIAGRIEINGQKLTIGLPELHAYTRLLRTSPDT